MTKEPKPPLPPNTKTRWPLPTFTFRTACRARWALEPSVAAAAGRMFGGFFAAWADSTSAYSANPPCMMVWDDVVTMMSPGAKCCLASVSSSRMATISPQTSWPGIHGNLHFRMKLTLPLMLRLSPGDKEHARTLISMSPGWLSARLHLGWVRSIRRTSSMAPKCVFTMAFMVSVGGVWPAIFVPGSVVSVVVVYAIVPTISSARMYTGIRYMCVCT
mmetsp:Transcript_44064/g.44573  ORF Transcript_44064/g.44573 Transcript_44064/m.44573 type:complete len:217 (-) Transcript_44064:2-652(-)